MDLSAEEQSRPSQDEGPPTSSSFGDAIADGRTNGTDAAKDEHQFQRAISAWRSINLSTLVQDLDKTASGIVENQRDSLVQRKELAQKTKDFRKLEDTAKLTEFKGLLKAYQSFIDLLTNHGKTTSSAFLQLYSSISEAPDPYPLLEASVDSLLLSEDTVPRLTTENEQLQKMVKNLTRDLETSESQIQNEKGLRKQLEESRETRSREVEASWQAVFDEKKNNWEAREKTLEEKLENQERLLTEIKASYEVSQRLGQNRDGSEVPNVSAEAAELEMVSSDLERTNQRLAEVEARNEQLRIELAQMSSGQSQKPNVEDDPDFARLRSDNASLLRKLDASKLERDSESRKDEARIRALERDAQSLKSEHDDLREKLHRWRDYPDIKRELEVFKAIEFSTGDDDEAQTQGAAERSQQWRDSGINGAAPGGKKDSLEQMLLTRNKKLSSEMAVLRVAHQELQREIEHLQNSVSTTNDDLEQARNLNATLENDLLALQQEASNQFPSSARSVSSRYPTSATYATSPYASRTRKSSPTSSIISGFDAQRSPYDSLDSLRAGEPAGGGSGILPMVQAQRDRFKQKVSQLEGELQKQYGLVSSLRQEVASLQKDNLNLYEKTRYASTYQRAPQQASSASAYGAHPRGASTVVPLPRDDEPVSPSMDRYRSAYEANLSPFAAFRGREATRAYRRMSAPERIIFSVTRLVLANRTSRNLFAAYCVALHVLIFVMLYWMQGADTQAHVAHLGKTATAAVAAAGTGGGRGVGEGGEARTGAGEAGGGAWRQEGHDGGPPR